jgi:hypothetical protein
LAAQALASLTSKLAALERDNANSAARVAELEARLAATTAERERGRGQSQSDDRQLEEEARRVRREVEILLGDERARREGEFCAFRLAACVAGLTDGAVRAETIDLERVVASLRAQNAHLDATLSAQKQTLDALRVSRTAAPATAAARNPQPEPYALRSEVQDLKHALAALGYEVDGVRTVVEELLREKEERDAGKKWEAEEAERRADLQAQAQAQAQARQPFASDDSIGATPPLDRHDAQVEDSVRSWVSQEEVEMLKREQREEAERQRRGMATTTVKVSTSLCPSGPLPRRSSIELVRKATAHRAPRSRQARLFDPLVSRPDLRSLGDGFLRGTERSLVRFRHVSHDRLVLVFFFGGSRRARLCASGTHLCLCSCGHSSRSSPIVFSSAAAAAAIER